MEQGLMTGNPVEAASRAGYDIQIRTAKQFKRNEETAVQKAIDSSVYSVETARKCLYFRPVGKDRDGRMNFADGISIRGAENLYTKWGNMRIGALITGEVDGNLVVRGICHDLENNVWVEKEATKNVTKANGQAYSDNQKTVVGQALSSIVIRNAFLANLPGYAKERFLSAVKESIAGSTQEEIEESWQDAIAGFKEFNVEEDSLRNLLKLNPEDSPSADNIVFLTGIYNGLKDNVFTVTDAFGFTEVAKAPPRKEPEKTKPKQQSPFKSKKEETKPAEEAEKMTITQKYNAAKLQMEEQFGEQEVKNFLIQYQGKFMTMISAFTNEQKAEITKEMINYVAKKGNAPGK